jgi:Protein of unknown function (DUF3467)
LIKNNTASLDHFINAIGIALTLTSIIHAIISVMDNNNNQQQQLNIELTDDMAQGVYSNLAVITHSPAEFVIDFIRVMPGVPKAKVQSRIILTPQHAKRLMNALKENISKFETQNGKIQDTQVQGNIIPTNFGGPQGMA